MLSPPFCHSHRVAQGKSPRHTALSVPFFLMHHVASVSPLYRSATNFSFFPATTWHKAKVLDTLLCRSSTEFFFSHTPRGKEQKSSTHCSTGPRPNFCLFHATSRHRATEFLSFPRHLVANVLRQHTALSVLDQILTFSTPLRGTAKVCDSPLHRFATKTLFFKMEIYAISWHKEKGS